VRLGTKSARGPLLIRDFSRDDTSSRGGTTKVATLCSAGVPLGDRLPVMVGAWLDFAEAVSRVSLSVRQSAHNKRVLKAVKPHVLGRVRRCLWSTSSSWCGRRLRQEGAGEVVSDHRLWSGGQSGQSCTLDR